MARVPDRTRLIHRRLERGIGAALLVHFAVVCTNIVVRRDPGEVLWLSHVGLLLAGLGLVLQSMFLVTTALAAVGALHGFWLVDSLSGLLFDRFPLGTTTYILTADRWTRIATAHHFYLAPLLLVVVWRHRAYPKGTLPAASTLFLVLTVISRTALAPAVNVNYAFRVAAVPDHPLVVWVNSLSAIPYLLVVNVFVTGLLLLPVVLLIRYRAQSLNTQAERLS